MTTKVEEFGKQFIESIRDNTLVNFEMIIQGKMKSKDGIELHNKISKLDNESLHNLRVIISEVVNETIFNTLFFFEENDEWLISSPNNGIENISDISDGLSGELYTEDGWLEKYSKFDNKGNKSI